MITCLNALTYKKIIIIYYYIIMSCGDIDINKCENVEFDIHECDYDEFEKLKKEFEKIKEKFDIMINSISEYNVEIQNSFMTKKVINCL